MSMMEKWNRKNGIIKRKKIIYSLHSIKISTFDYKIK